MNLTLEELWRQAEDLRAKIGRICGNPACPHCPQYRALLQRIEELRGEPDMHGRNSTYTRGCRCARCCQAHTNYQRWRREDAREVSS